MPLYEYQCENCGEVFELIEKFSAEPLTVHEKCGGKVHRLISAPALQFKGSGWYVTDYAKSGSSTPGNGGPKKDGDSGSSGGSSEKGASESKEAASSSKDSGSGSGSSSDSAKTTSTTSTTTSNTSSDKK